MIFHGFMPMNFKYSLSKNQWKGKVGKGIQLIIFPQSKEAGNCTH
jgi:hypothetical protein